MKTAALVAVAVVLVLAVVLFILSWALNGILNR